MLELIRIFRYDYHNKVVSDLEDTVIILSNALNGARIQNIKVTEEAVKCFQVGSALHHHF